MSETTTAVLSSASLMYLDGINERPILSNGFMRLCRHAFRSSSSDDDAFDVITMPTTTDTAKALEWAGLKTDFADQVITEYFRLKAWDFATDSADVEDIAIRMIQCSGYDCDETDSIQTWNVTLDNLGIKSDYRQHILNPEHEVIRTTKSAKEWAIDIVQTTLGFLNHANDLIKLKKDIAAVQAGTSAPPPDTIEAHRQEKSFPQDAPTTLIIFTEKPVKKPNEKVLYRGCEACRLYQTVHNRTESLKTGALISWPPRDFDQRSAVYLTEQKKTAIAYAKMKSYNKCIDIGLMTINVPQDLLADGYAMKDGIEFKRFVTYNRGTCQFNVPLIQKLGPVCGMSNNVVQELSSPANVTAKYIDEIACTQHCFREGRYQELATRCLNKVYVEILPNPEK